MNSNKHILVTGGAGFIGSNIVASLLSKGFKVTILDDLSTGQKSNIPLGAHFIRMDLTQEDALNSLESLRCDAVFHLAGQSSGEGSFKDPAKDMQSHVFSTISLLEWCRKKGVRRFLYASSMSVYGEPLKLPVAEAHSLNPKSFYGIAKMCAESYIRFYQMMGIDTTIFRLFSVYGPGQNLDNRIQGMVSIFLSYMLGGEPILVRGSKERFRDFVYIQDVVDAWMSAYANPVSYGKIYNVASAKKTSVEELIESLKSSFGDRNYPVQYGDSTPGDQFGVTGDYSLIKKELNWQPTVNLLSGLKKMVEFEKERVRIE